MHKIIMSIAALLFSIAALFYSIDRCTAAPQSLTNDKSTWVVANDQGIWAVQQNSWTFSAGSFSIIKLK